MPVRLVSILLVFFLLLFTGVAWAQSENTITISSPDQTQYPKMSFFFWPLDDQGIFINTVTVSELHVFENDREVQVNSLELQQPGIHFVVAFNEGPTLANYYASVSRFDRMKAVLSSWAKDQSIATLDDFSLVSNNGVVKTRLTSPSEWVQAISDYQPDLKNANPSMNSLSQAIDLASTTSSGDNKIRVVLYITPLPTADQLTGLQDLAQRAAQSNVKLFIWLVGPKSYAEEQAAQVLKQASQDTGGQFFLFSGAETLPTVSTYLDPLNYEYKVTYTTTIQESGSYTLAVQIDQKNYQAASEKKPFDITVLPPNPIFLSPPTLITRNWVQAGQAKEWSLAPDIYKITYMVEFPDGHSRDIKLARLFVDGKLAVEDDAAPFGEFTLDLSAFTQSEYHKLQIYVEDITGLSAETIETTIEVVVTEKPLNDFQKFIASINLQTVVIGAFLAIVALGLILFFRRSVLGKKSAKSKNQQISDPLRQPVITDEFEYATKPSERDASGWPRLPGGSKAPARLISVQSSESQAYEKKQVALPLQETTLGSDSKRCDITLQGPTVSQLHARIFTDDAKNFFIADAGSAAGTWINYAPVSQQGTHLEHGDLINIGAFTFRFEVINPEGRPIQVLPYNGE